MPAPESGQLWHARPAVREDTPLIIGLAGPTKSGKTYSAHRLAIGLKAGLGLTGPIVMLNAEGRRGHQYAEKFKYTGVDIQPPYSPARYDSAVTYIKTLMPAVLIVDSASHMHDGPGGLLEWHDAELTRLAGTDDAKRHKVSGTAWIEPKKAENAFIYTLLGLEIPILLCFRAKQKYELPSYKDLGWQPIAGERITFETLFTLVLPPHSKGVPDLGLSELREPFDVMIPKGQLLDEELGRKLAEWSKGTKKAAVDPERQAALQSVSDELVKLGLNGGSEDDKQRRGEALERAYGTRSWKSIEGLAVEVLRAGLVKLQAPLPATTSGTAVVPGGSAPVTVASTPAEQPGLALTAPATSTKATEPVLEERAPWDEEPSPIDGGRRDESTAKGLVASIEAEVKKWPKVPPQAVLEVIWSGYLGGAKDLAKADPAVLTDILQDVRAYTKKDPAAMAKINGYARAARVAS